MRYYEHLEGNSFHVHKKSFEETFKIISSFLRSKPFHPLLLKFSRKDRMRHNLRYTYISLPILCSTYLKVSLLLQQNILLPVMVKNCGALVK